VRDDLQGPADRPRAHRGGHGTILGAGTATRFPYRHRGHRGGAGL